MNIKLILLLPPLLLGQHPLFMEAEHRTEDVCVCVCVCLCACALVRTLEKKIPTTGMLTYKRTKPPE